jgi:hypothetical protein
MRGRDPLRMHLPLSLLSSGKVLFLPMNMLTRARDPPSTSHLRLGLGLVRRKCPSSLPNGSEVECVSWLLTLREWGLSEAPLQIRLASLRPSPGPMCAFEEVVLRLHAGLS